MIFEATALFSHSIHWLKAGITSKLASEGVFDLKTASLSQTYT